ncbi:MAG: LLM class flavin-dependent oxidoreductase, partial [Acidobacteria bacterium]|nr:LLM class flavin-dependent oxidoreductase [Acidobacteriota bacterium]
MTQLTLYTRPGCHLCDDLKETLLRVRRRQAFEFREVDVSRDPALERRYGQDIPVLLMAMGDNSLRLAGRIADGVVLHTFMSDTAVARSVRLVREAAERAGRDPAQVRIWSVMA